MQYIKRCLKIADHKKQLKKNITHADIAELFLFVNLMVTATYKNNILTKMKHLEMMIWFLMTFKWFQYKLLIWIPWWDSVYQERTGRKRNKITKILLKQEWPGIESSDSGSRIANSFLYVVNQTLLLQLLHKPYITQMFQKRIIRFLKLSKLQQR